MSKEAYKMRELGEYIVADPYRGFGKPTFKGTRKSVENIILSFKEGHSLDEVAQLWGLSPEAVLEALQLAATSAREYYRVSAPELEAPDAEEDDSQLVKAETSGGQ